MLRAAWTSVWLACAACGGAIAAEPPEGGVAADAGVVLDVGVSPPVADATPVPPVDAAIEQAPAQSCATLEPDASCSVIEMCVLSLVDDDDGGLLVWRFTRESDLLAFARTLAVNACNDQGIQSACGDGCDVFATCTYDPFSPAPPDASPSNYANAHGQFEGPDGLDYVVAYLPTMNEWVLIRRDRDPVGYQLVLEYNECVNDAG